MTVETRPNSGQLTGSLNGRSSLTERGRAVHELILKDTLLRNHRNPRIAFALSPELSIQYSQRVTELCSQLGLPQDGKARESAINGYKGKLIQIGHPHWRLPEH